MLRKALKVTSVLSGCLVVAASLGSLSVAAASSYKHRQPVAHYYRQSPALPYGPEYGFLTGVPPNAIRRPGYTFVPGVGILGESCDLPTSACSNEYRDVQ
jgi:hypothetical protein